MVDGKEIHGSFPHFGKVFLRFFGRRQTKVPRQYETSQSIVRTQTRCCSKFDISDITFEVYKRNGLHFLYCK